MYDNARKIDYENSANEYWRWVLAAEDLLIAANILEEKYKNALTSIIYTQAGKMPLESQILAQTIYFKAKSLELFIKGLYIKQGKQVTKNGKFTCKSHDLLKLCQDTCIAVNPAQKISLKKMTDCIIFWGTYPVTLDYRKWRLDNEGIVGIQPVFLWSQTDDNSFKEILKQVRNLVDLKNDKNLPWSTT